MSIIKNIKKQFLDQTKAKKDEIKRKIEEEEKKKIIKQDNFILFEDTVRIDSFIDDLRDLKKFYNLETKRLDEPEKNFKYDFRTDKDYEKSFSLHFYREVGKNNQHSLAFIQIYHYDVKPYIYVGEETFHGYKETYARQYGDRARKSFFERIGENVLKKTDEFFNTY